MAVSGVTAFSMTARDMVKQAMVELGALNSGEDPTADELTDALVRLNSMLKSWQTQGVNLWREDEQTVTITAATASVTLAAGIRQVFSARHIDDYERLLGQWERGDYLSLPNKDTEGNPTIFYVSRQRDALVMYFWPVPTTNQTVKIDCERIVNTVVDAAETVDVPVHANEAVWVNLAVRLIPMLGTAKLDPARVQMVQGRAQELYAMLLDDDRPQSVFIGPA